MRFLTNDDLRLTRAEAEELRGVAREHQAYRLRKGFRDQRELARRRGVRMVDRKSDVRQDFQITPELFHAVGTAWGYEKWDDPEFVEWVKREHAETVVQTRISQTTVAAPYVPSRPKFHKSYGSL
jgi:hypothetical protein